MKISDICYQISLKRSPWHWWIQVGYARDPWSPSRSYFFHYCSQMKLRKGNVFTSMCQEFCRLGGVHPSMHLGRHPPRQTPWADTPWADPPGRHLPWADPTRQTHPGRHPRQTHPLPQWPLQQTVHILLECILVFMKFAAKILSNNRFSAHIQGLAPSPLGKTLIRHCMINIYCRYGKYGKSFSAVNSKKNNSHTTTISPNWPLISVVSHNLSLCRKRLNLP